MWYTNPNIRPDGEPQRLKEFTHYDSGTAILAVPIAFAMLSLTNHTTNVLLLALPAPEEAHVLMRLTNLQTCQQTFQVLNTARDCHGRLRLSILLGDLPAGQYKLALYAQASSTNLNPANATPLQTDLDLRIQDPFSC